MPGTGGLRYPPNIRWTGILQFKLGSQYEVIEEGLSARTTTIDDDKRYGRNGKTFLPICLESHLPLDVVILNLGTNDLKERYHRSLTQVQQGIEELLKTIQQIAFDSQQKPSHIILLSPPRVDESAPGVESNYKGAEILSKQFGPLYKSLSEKYQTDFLDLAAIISPSKKDGLHLDPDAHAKIAEALYTLILKI